MKSNFICKLKFNEALRDKWPDKGFVAEARLPGNGSDGPWSVRAELWSPPNNDGETHATIGFLNQTVVQEFEDLAHSFLLTLGNTPVAECTLEENLTEGLGSERKP